MPNYQNGKIYKITAGELTYIGSTCEPALARRLAGHVKSHKSWKNGNGNNVSSYPLIETGQYEITLIELFPCNTKDELTARERFHIESTVCVNKMIPGRTYKEWEEANIETLREYRKKYKEVNSETIREYHKTYREANIEAICEYKNKYYEDKAETICKKAKVYREANVEAIRKYQKKYREARKSNSAESV